MIRLKSPVNPNRSRQRRYITGLTLIELTVVGVIVAILSAISTEVFVVAKHAVLRRACASNLRQIHVSLALYQNDHDDYFPPYGTPPLDNNGDAIRDGLLKQTLRLYGAADDQLYCPLDQHRRTTHPSEFGTHLNTSYIFHLSRYWIGKAGTGPDNPVPFGGMNIGDPSAFDIAMDQMELVHNEDGSRIRLSSHGETCSTLYSDGHVKEVKFIQPDGT